MDCDAPSVAGVASGFCLSSLIRSAGIGTNARARLQSRHPASASATLLSLSWTATADEQFAARPPGIGEARHPARSANAGQSHHAAWSAYDERRRALLTEHRIPENEADWEDKLRYAALHPGEHDDWSFAYGEFTRQRGQRAQSAVQASGRTQRVAAGADDGLIPRLLRATCIPKQHCAALKLAGARRKLNELNATMPSYSYAPVHRSKTIRRRRPNPRQGRLAGARRGSPARKKCRCRPCGRSGSPG